MCLFVQLTCGRVWVEVLDILSCLYCVACFSHMSRQGTGRGSAANGTSTGALMKLKSLILAV